MTLAILKSDEIQGSGFSLLPASKIEAESTAFYGLEIAGLNLTGTDLVTLSACETGVEALWITQTACTA